MLIVCTKVSLSQSADSLAYDSLRTRVAAIDSTHPALQTADALAGAGLYDDASAILSEHAPADPAESTHGERGSPRTTQWRISSGVDFYHLEDHDTVGMNAEELRNYQRLTETPLSVWLRAKSTILPQAAFLGELSPEVYVSERKSRLSAVARSSLLSGLLHLEPSVKAEKWYRDSVQDASFAPFARQSSDMGGAAMMLTATNADKTPGTSFIWTAPVSVDWEHYRSNRWGYESFVEYGVSPSLEIRPEGKSVGTRISARGWYEDFYGSDTDDLDVARFSGLLEGMGRNEKYNAVVSAGWMGDWYTGACGDTTATLEVVSRFESSGRFEYTQSPTLKGQLRLRGIREREKYDSTGRLGFFRRGSELTIEPGLEFTIDDHAAITPSLLWDRRWNDMNGDRYLWEAYRAWEPGLRLGWSSEIVDASVRGSFRDEKADDVNLSGDSRSLRAGADAIVNMGHRVSVNLFADYQFRVYEKDARMTENISLSASATVRL